MAVKPSYEDLEQKIYLLEKETEKRMNLGRELQEKSQCLFDTNTSLEKAIFKANQMAADVEIQKYQLQLEIEKKINLDNINHALFKISNAINTTESLEDLYQLIHKTLLEVMAVKNFMIAIYDNENDMISFPYLVDEKEEKISNLYNISKLKNSLTWEVIFSKKPLFVKKNKLIQGSDNVNLENCLGHPPMVWLGVPLIVNNEVIGVMVTQSYTDQNHFAMSDLDIFVSVSEQIALSIDRKRSHRALIESERKYRTILSSIEDGYCEVDNKGFITFTNDAMHKITGYLRDELIGINSVSLIYDEDKKSAIDSLVKTLKSGGNLSEISYRMICKNKSIKHVGHSISTIIGAGGKKTGLRYVVRDIDKRKKYEEELIYLANHDGLTGLKNRKAFYEKLHNCIQKAIRNKNKIALMFLDIDKFKDVNDTFGHEAGDYLLKLIAERLIGSIRCTDFVARIGGDEFTIIIDDDKEFHPGKVAEKILIELSSPYEIKNQMVNYISTSIGISVYPDNSKNLEELINMADDAMYKAKKKRNSYQIYTHLDLSL